jgi:hypothetical protein
MKRVRLAILVCMILISGAVLAAFFFNLLGRKEIKEPEPLPKETAADAKMYLKNPICGRQKGTQDLGVGSEVD